MLIKELTHSVNIPEGVSIDSSSSNVKVSGPRGELSRNFEHTAIKFEQDEKTSVYRTIGYVLFRSKHPSILRNNIY